MKLLRKVSAKEVKRDFVVSQLVRLTRGKKLFLKKLTPKEFATKLAASKRKVLRMPEKALDRFIGDDYLPRLRSYNACDWYVAEVKTSEVGVWKQAGGLPPRATKGSLKKTADFVRTALAKRPIRLLGRVRRVVPRMIETNINELQKEKYLLPIVFKGGTGTRGRRGLKPVLKGDIDDGCMRSIALAVHGAETLRVYYGMPKR